MSNSAHINFLPSFSFLSLFYIKMEVKIEDTFYSTYFQLR